MQKKSDVHTTKLVNSELFNPGMFLYGAQIFLLSPQVLKVKRGEMGFLAKTVNETESCFF